VGLDEAFIVERDWNKYEFIFQAVQTFPLSQAGCNSGLKAKAFLVG
jgi:hypothetical protein